MRIYTGTIFAAAKRTNDVHLGWTCHAITWFKTAEERDVLVNDGGEWQSIHSRVYYDLLRGGVKKVSFSVSK